jgi:ATP-dependent helicase/nuclease subunit B
MGDALHPQVLTIPPIRPFADALVAGLIARHGTNALSLAQGIILVPNNRGGQAIREAFVRQAEKGLLLPRLVAIGDVDLAESIGAALDSIDDEPIPPAVDPLQRQLILARLIQQQDGSDAAEAMRLAAELARTLDQLIVEEVSPARLRNIALEGELSRHWAVSLEQLKAILDLWPEELKRLGRIDLADRRNRQLDRVAERWRQTPTPGFVVAAGISSAAPAIARLMKAVSRLPLGQVVLAGLDRLVPDEDWQAILGDETVPPMETHPQFHLRQLLDRMGVARNEVQDWPGAGKAKPAMLRAAAIGHAFAPPLATRNWVNISAKDLRLDGVSALELSTPAEEAQAIAIAIREAMDVPGRTVALVTPDRELAKRVSAHLERWGIAADDSAGQSLAAVANGSLILTLARASVERFAPNALLTLLKHPLVRAGEGRLAWLDGARKLDLALRGPRPAPGLDGIAQFLAGGDDRTRPDREAVKHWWAEVADLLSPLESLRSGNLAQSIGLLRAAATSLAGDAVWAGQAGRALADLVGDLEAGAEDGPKQVDPTSLPALLRQLMEEIAIRPGYGGHPRVAIWGLLEAKLQSADLMILGGLNEGVWPQIPSPDPWLAPRIRRELGLPSLERRIGLSAHDLAGALGAPEVLLTRAARDARSPTIASRFWLRIEAMTGGLRPPQTRYDCLARALDASALPPERAQRPRPRPPVDERPHTISVTDVDRLSADPYAFYAKAMLKLQALDPLDADPGPAWRGSLIHDVLEVWAKEDDYAPGHLVARIEAALSDGTVHPLIRALWLPRLNEAATWIEGNVAQNRSEGRQPLRAEVSGRTEFAGVAIKGRADRIDRLPDGALAVIDYKTGAPPDNRQIGAGFAMQLGLIGLIAEHGGFDGVSGTATAFEYWSLARDQRTRAFGKVSSPVTGKTAVSEPDAFVARVAAQFAVAASKWLTGDAAFTAKLQPDYAWSDYDQLMRLEEWQGRE